MKCWLWYLLLLSGVGGERSMCNFVVQFLRFLAWNSWWFLYTRIFNGISYIWFSYFNLYFYILYNKEEVSISSSPLTCSIFNQLCQGVVERGVKVRAEAQSPLWTGSQGRVEHLQLHRWLVLTAHYMLGRQGCWKKTIKIQVESDPKSHLNL